MIPRSAADGPKLNSRKADEVFAEHGTQPMKRQAPQPSLTHPSTPMVD